MQTEQNQEEDVTSSTIVTSRVFPIVCAAIATGVFILDTITAAEVVVAMLYVGVVLLCARFLPRRGIVLASSGCMALLVLSYFLSQYGGSSDAALPNLLLSLAVIGMTAFLAVQNQSREMVLREQAGLLDLTHDTIFVRDMTDIIVYWNRGAEELYGWKKKEAVGKMSHQLMQTIFPMPLEEIMAKLLRTGRWEGELVHVRKNGTQATVASRWAVQQDARGRAVAILETNNDITERKRAEEALRESETRYRNIFETAGVSIWEEDFSQVKAIIDELKAQGVRDFRAHFAAHTEFVQYAVSMVKIVDVNDATVKLFGAQSKGELLGSLRAIFTPETLDVFAGELLAVAEERASFAAETTVQTLKGDTLSVLFTIMFPQSTKLESVLVTIVDVTERKRAAEALRDTQMELAHVNRVTTMGQMTASIAHEVNQPVAAAVTNAAAALRWLGAQPPNLEEVRQALGRIIENAGRASDVIGRVRAIIKRGPPRKDRFDLNEAILDVMAMTRGEVLKHGVSPQTKLAAGLLSVEGDRVQLQQVILNLVLNAVEAMSAVDEGTRELRISTETDATGGVLVTVRDSGQGLDQKSVDRLFEAFYTTKPDGLGMGLAICRSIVEAHGGRLWGSANEPRGAVFQFTLPPERDETASAEQADLPPALPVA
jgi:PAS domain S-box-containing protein